MELDLSEYVIVDEENVEDEHDEEEDEVSRPVRVILFEYKQNDPKRDTGMKLVRLNLARSLRPGDPFKGIVLSAEGLCVLSPLDRGLVQSTGIGCVNCSWNRLNEVTNMPGGKISRHRKLPFLIAANPTNYGKAFKLSSAEALAGGLAILGFIKEAKKLTEKFAWDHEFWKLNSDLVYRYSQCTNRDEVLAIQEEMLSRGGAQKEGECSYEDVYEKIGQKSVQFNPVLMVKEFVKTDVIEAVEPIDAPTVDEAPQVREDEYAWPLEPPKDMRKCLVIIRESIGKPHVSGNVLAKTKRKEYIDIWSQFIRENNEKYFVTFAKEFPAFLKPL